MLKYTLLLFFAVLLSIFGFFRKTHTLSLPEIKSGKDVSALFPSTLRELEGKVEKTIKAAKNKLGEIISISSENRTFGNTLNHIDLVSAYIRGCLVSIYTLQMVSPDLKIREASQKAVLRLQSFFIEEITNNYRLYEAVKEYVASGKSKENLDPEEERYLTELMRDFKKSGMGLLEGERKIIRELDKKLAELSLQFSMNINGDNGFIEVNKKNLKGLEESFVEVLEKSERDGFCKIGLDCPSYFAVMENCSVEDTRKKMLRAFKNRAHPANEQILKDFIKLRNKKAKLVGYKSAAHLGIDGEMAKSPEEVRIFLRQLVVKSEPKVKSELGVLKQNLPEGVLLDEKGKIKPWDLEYLKSKKKKSLQINEEKIKEYFSLERTLKKIFEVYSTFLGLKFYEEKINLWHEDVRAISIKDGADSLLGYIILDLFPRENKFTHACQITVVQALKKKNGERSPAVSAILANFPKPTKEKPALLKRQDVVTFFHEFGHVMHAMLGATKLAGFSGTSVKSDFVEVPSQAFEEWMFDPEILKMVSFHYETKEPLDDETIKRIRELKKFDSGYFVRRQVGISLFSLACFEEGEVKDPYKLKKDIFEKLFEEIAFDEEDDFEASFGHITSYMEKYYGYLWSKIFAMDIFRYIKKFGLMNYEIGKQYKEKVLSKGGSRDPMELLKEFLGRESSPDAFFEELGL